MRRTRAPTGGNWKSHPGIWFPPFAQDTSRNLQTSVTERSYSVEDVSLARIIFLRLLYTGRPLPRNPPRPTSFSQNESGSPFRCARTVPRFSVYAKLIRDEIIRRGQRDHLRGWSSLKRVGRGQTVGTKIERGAITMDRYEGFQTPATTVRGRDASRCGVDLSEFSFVL